MYILGAAFVVGHFNEDLSTIIAGTISTSGSAETELTHNKNRKLKPQTYRTLSPPDTYSLSVCRAIVKEL